MASTKPLRLKDDVSMVVALTDGKTTIKQKPLALDKVSDTLQELVAFRTMYNQSQDVLTAIPNAHLPLIAKLTHESSMLVGGLARAIRKLLIPDETTSSTPTDKCPLSIIELAITTVADRVNYGIEGVAAAGLSEWRWEVKDFAMLPAELKDRLETRKADRVKAKAKLAELFDALPADVREELSKKGGRKEKAAKDAKPEVKDVKVALQDAKQDTVASVSSDALNPSPSKSQAALSGEENVDVSKKTKTIDPAKAEKDAAKKKNDEEVKKSAAKFTSFFKKPAAKPTSLSQKEVLENHRRTVSVQVSDFAATFHPFTIRKDVSVAPVNRFATASYLQQCQTTTNVELNKDGVPVINLTEDAESSTPSQSNVLKDFVGSVPAKYRVNCVPSRRGFKTRPSFSVKETIDKLNDAEIDDNYPVANELVQQLKDRKRFIAKLFQYHEDVRPQYWGTWTRSSKAVGPRTPFAKHVDLNYEYDSEEDWEEEDEEGVGEDVAAMEVDSDEGDGDLDGDDDDDLDSFLAPDDEIEEVITGSPPPLDDDPFFGPNALQLPKLSTGGAAKPYITKKRKSAASGKNADDGGGHKKRKVMLLVPWYKGLCYEDAAGRCDVPGFNAHRIRLLNDTPYPIDPFTWVPPSETPAPKLQTAATTSIPVSGTAIPAIASSSTAPAFNHSKKMQFEPSTQFPDEHLPTLLKVLTAEDAPLNVLVETVYRELREHKVFKNCIEKKIRAISHRVGKRWVLNSDFAAPPPPLHSLVQPQATF